MRQEQKTVDGRTVQKKSSKASAGFMEGKYGPFECGRCVHFDEQAQACELVDGTIDADDCCNLFYPTRGAKR